MRLVDTHCHLDLMSDPEACLMSAERAEIHTIAVTNAPSVFAHTQALCSGRRFVYAAVGLHPELVGSRASELSLLIESLTKTRFVGEVGLDYVTTDQELRNKQRDVFEAIIAACSKHGDKLLTIHSRRSAADVIEIVGRDFRGKAILHWFSGTHRELVRAIDYGFFFSANPAMVRSKSGQSLLNAIPRDKVLTETDGPFVSITGRPAVPGDVRLVVSELAKIWDISNAEAAEQIRSTFDTLIS